MTDTIGTFLETKHLLTEAGPVVAPENDEVLGLGGCLVGENFWSKCHVNSLTRCREGFSDTN